MEYNSFYGGRRGASFIIVKSYKSIAEMVTAFKKGGDYTTVNYDEYVLINTENKNNIENGNLYRRGYDYTNEMGGAEYIGQIVGPAGLGPHAELTTIDEVQRQYNKADADHLDYRHDSGNYAPTTNLVPGAKGTENNRTFDTTTDSIQWEYVSVRDAQQLESTAYVGFKFPYTIIDYLAETIDEAYTSNAEHLAQTKVTRMDDKQHPFYEQWKITIPKGVKGDTLQNFKLYTPTAAETMQDIDGNSHNLTAGKTVLVYDYIHYDEKSAGELTTVYLGEYDVIDDVTLDANGTITVIYKGNKQDKVFSKALKYITSVTLTQQGHLTVNYNNDRQIDGQGQKYETDLIWVRDLALAANGVVTITYNNNTTQDLTNKIKWVTSVDTATDGKITTNFNDGTSSIATGIVKWLVGSSYDAATGKLTFTYNTGDTEQYTYKWINSVTLDEHGNFVVKDNTGATMLDTYVNSIIRTVIPTDPHSKYQYHLLIKNSVADPTREIADEEAYNGYQDLGLVKDYNGILIGTHFDADDYPEMAQIHSAIVYLDTNYPDGITEGYAAGKVVTAGREGEEKRFFAYDYEHEHWIYLGSTSGVSTIRSVIAGDDSVEEQALDLPDGSLWFVVEGEDD